MAIDLFLFVICLILIIGIRGICRRIDALRESAFQMQLMMREFHREWPKLEISDIHKEVRTIADRVLFAVIEAETIRRGMGLANDTRRS